MAYTVKWDRAIRLWGMFHREIHGNGSGFCLPDSVAWLQ